MSNAALPFSLSQARILVVDDSEFSLQLITSVLQTRGYNKLHTARDGIEALKMTRSLQPDLVILDYKMPNLDGFGYCQQVRADAALPRMPIIMQTAVEERTVKLEALSCGADDFLNKPLDKDELDLRVRLHLDRYFMLQQAQQINQYLKMELEEARHVIDKLDTADLPHTAARVLRRHFEVLETMTVLPAKIA